MLTNSVTASLTHSVTASLTHSVTASLTKRIALILAVSISAFTISLILDLLLAPLSPILQFIVQVPTLVLLIEEGRNYALANSDTLGISHRDINGAFFFAAPLTALAARSLFTDIRRTIFSCAK
jgi:hypothetical protein